MPVVVRILLVIVVILAAAAVFFFLYYKEMFSPVKTMIVSVLGYVMFYLHDMGEDTVILSTSDKTIYLRDIGDKLVYFYAVMGVVALAIVIHTLVVSRLKAIVAIPLNFGVGAYIGHYLVYMDVADHPFRRTLCFLGVIVLGIILQAAYSALKEEVEFGGFAESSVSSGEVPETVSLADLSPAMQRLVLQTAARAGAVPTGGGRQADVDLGYGGAVSEGEESVFSNPVEWVGDDRYQDIAGRTYDSMGHEIYEYHDESPYRRMDDGE